MAVQDNSFTLDATRVLEKGTASTKPIVGSVSTLADGASATVKGIGFGSTGPTIANIIYDNFSDETSGNPMDTSPTVGSAWSGFKATGAPTVSNLFAHTGSNSIITIQEATDYYGIVHSFTAATEYFLSFAVLTPTGKTLPGTNVKLAWVHSVDSNTNDIAMFVHLTSPFSVGSNDLPNAQAVHLASETDGDYQYGDWNYCKFWVRADASNPSTVAGKWWGTMETEGVQFSDLEYPLNQTDNTDIIVFEGGTVPYQFTTLNILGYAQGIVTSQMYMDDIHFCSGLNSCCRVELCDNSDYASRTRTMVCEPTAWADDQITFTVRQGSHASLSGLFLFVFNENNEHNVKGFAV